MIVKGRIMWAKVNSSIEIYGEEEKGYSLKLYIADESLKKIKELAMQELEKAKADTNWTYGKKKKKKKPTKWDGESIFPFKTDKEGNDYIILKSYHVNTDEDGNITGRRYIDVFDKTEGKSGRDLWPDHKNIVIGNGTEAVASFAISVYWNNQRMHGVKLYLNALQITKFIPRHGGSAEGYGFEVREDSEFEAEDFI